jgi:hypothetical protein
MHRVAGPGGDVEVKQFRSCASEQHIERFDVSVDQPFVVQFHPLVQLGFRQVALATFSIQPLEARRIRMKSDERVQQIECNVYCLPVAKALLPGDKLIE